MLNSTYKIKEKNSGKRETLKGFSNKGNCDLGYLMDYLNRLV